MWKNTSISLNEDISSVILDSDDDITSENIRQDIFIDSSDKDESISMKRESLNLYSSPIIEDKVKKSFMKHRIIYSDNESISDVDEKLSNSKSESEADNISDDDSKSTSSKNAENYKRKDVTHDYSKDNVKEFKLGKYFDSINDDSVDFNDTNESENSEQKLVDDKKNLSEKEKINANRQDKELSIVDFTRPEDKELSIVNLTHCDIDSDSDLDYLPKSRSSEENALAISLAKQEIGVGNINPLAAQENALLTCKLRHLQNQIDKTKLLLNTANLDLLPDKGKKLQENIILQEKEMKEIKEKLERTPLIQPIKQVNEQIILDDEEEEEKSLLSSKYLQSTSEYVYTEPGKSAETIESKKLGKRAQETLNREFTLTAERLQDLHGSLVAQPSEDTKAEDPPGLKVKLMPHQQHALAWLMWRERKRPPGGVLADDMGLGKTLTMISLIMATRNQDDSESDDEWYTSNKPIISKGGTLVVCPASLLSQWENEIKSKCKRGILSVEVYHGNNREKISNRLAKYDVVITTYNILSREFKTMSTTYKIHWKRIILDEAHCIRNHKSQASQAVCGLLADKRWTLTGTPIQNKEMDLYSLLKFLKCSPFDDIRVWKRWVDNKNVSGHQRLATLMKSLMLRRTKQELQAQGALESLPNKNIKEIEVNLDPQEKLVYEKVLIYSRTLFAQFLAQRAEKDHMVDLESGLYDKPTFLSNPNKKTQFTNAQNKLLSLHADVKSHEILVLLLRLRQICCHPSLIHAMLDQDDLEQSGIVEENNDIISRVNNMSLYENEENQDVNNKEIGIDQEVSKNLLTSTNPVFESDRLSSKMKALFNVVEEIIEKKDKLLIVSQWSSMFDIIGSHLSAIKGATFTEFSGRVPIKNRQSIIESFNNPNEDPKILLLSLTAGGVGLNLVGGNHLLLIDIHWNPQLESQAQDRVYRFGQKKDVFIYKFICKDTIEERIKLLQDKKLAISQNVLSGENNKINSKLTLNDLKSLFGL
ncbi:PREDICTED: transcription termination factor 2-like [Polistes canadensis]|uniref:transcription termination factor 2-like n=1 Tax=Polistes canadensis TaxID=91411 RepID=UPI000718CF0F|nr:PREDICTED: transcription termination factor 2-like [Polistes canadensis]XP_014612649.1 PREDICTED: transcription termination factor 2-like [Polistes canadensis]XP_014612650.1 PREDICTED: transcription termination factor 2-like [Polistes canadensis]XP_014612651.1 PREDICTED: transcription termination factor 2-like [Polistes canadensis]